MSRLLPCKGIPVAAVVAAVLLAWAGGGMARAQDRAGDRAAGLMAGGAEAFRRGDYGAAERDWRGADAAYAKAGDLGGRLDAWLNLGAVQQQTGNFPVAENTLMTAEAAAREGGRADKLVGIQNALGVLYTFTRRPELAERTLNEALTLAGEQGADAAAVAGIQNNRGNLYAAWAELLRDQGKPDTYKQAFDAYAEGARLAKDAGDATLAAKATANAALSAARGGETEKANEWAGQVAREAKDLPDSLDKANLLVTAGQADQALLAGDAKAIDAGRVQRRAFEAYEAARQVAMKLNHPLTASYAVGYQGRLYETAKRYDEALTLTRRAVMLAQQAMSDDSLFLWQWQTGRILRAQGQQEEAVAAYVRARDSLQQVRSDQALSHGNRGMRSTFRNDIGPLYYELADLLLARADASTDAVRMTQYLTDARETVERLRVGEFQEYFEDPCVNQVQAQQVDLTRELGQITRGNPAVVYLIPLSDRVEILLTTREGMKRIKSTDVGSAKLTEAVRTFRTQLETRRNHKYLASAKQLYEWLIRPIEPVLEAEGIDTLVFVPDGALRTVPMAALHDGSDFLIAKYAVAVSPGLSLSLREGQAEAVSASAGRVLASGLSESAQGFAALPNVDEELAVIEDLYGATKLLNEDFQVPAFTRALDPTEQYTIVHIASHGVFAADVNDTFVVTYEGSLNLNNLESLLRPYQVQGKPIDLLTLSACQTSAGDDQSALERASLGLGGLAVKAGARSAMASLWFANDQATGQLVREFYTQLRDNPEAGKAKALQQAQLRMIRDEAFSHPIYWAPFLMIGDWL